MNILPCNTCGEQVDIMKVGKGRECYVVTCSNINCPSVQIHTSEEAAVKAANIRYDLNAKLVDQQQAMIEHIHYLMEIVRETMRFTNEIDKLTRTTEPCK